MSSLAVLYFGYNHINVQKANGCSWCLGAICWAWGKFHIKTQFQLWPKIEEKCYGLEWIPLWMSYPYPQNCKVKLIRWDLNEIKAVGSKRRVLSPLATPGLLSCGVSTDQAQALIGAVISILLHQLGSTKQSCPSFPFANNSTSVWFFIRNKD